MDFQGAEDAGGDSHAVAGGLDAVEEGLDALLQVFVVGAREAFEGVHEAGHLAEYAAGFSAEEFETVGIWCREGVSRPFGNLALLLGTGNLTFLLRHEGASGAVSVCQPDEGELGCGIDDQIL